MLLASASDFVVTLFFNPPYGSIPSCKEVFMAKFNVLFKAAVSKFHALLSHWVTKATLLALGFWCFPLQPYGYSFISAGPTSGSTRRTIKPARALT